VRGSTQIRRVFWYIRSTVMFPAEPPNSVPGTSRDSIFTASIVCSNRYVVRPLTDSSPS
jgi:hypothetical protein